MRSIIAAIALVFLTVILGCATSPGANSAEREARAKVEANWPRIVIGMSFDDVQNLIGPLGEPSGAHLDITIGGAKKGTQEISKLYNCPAPKVCTLVFSDSKLTKIR